MAPALTRHEAGEDARFDAKESRFHYTDPLAPSGDYHLAWRKAEASDQFFYFPEHTLAQKIIASASDRATPIAQLVFGYSGHGSIISPRQPLVGNSGWMTVSRMAVTSFEREEVLLFAGDTDTPHPERHGPGCGLGRGHLPEVFPPSCPGQPIKPNGAPAQGAQRSPGHPPARARTQDRGTQR